MRLSFFIAIIAVVFFLFEQNASGQSTIVPSTVNVNSLSDAQIQKIIQEINARGLTQEQAIALAKAQGASQVQIDQLIMKIQQQQMTPSVSATQPDVIEDKNPPVKYSSPKARVNVSEKTKKIFGYQLFNSENLTFEPSVNIPIPQDYVLGNGDQLTIIVWGASQSRQQLSIDKNGSITIPDVGPIFLSGVSFEKGQAMIKKRLMSIYSGMSGSYPNTWAEVSLGAVHSVKINVIGEINAPGTYTLPSTASAFNALYLSGGPNENGSFREINLIREGKTIKTIDIYDFLINADPSANVQLREQDILFVPTFKTRVEIAGEIKRSGYFEIKTGETLSDLVRFAGGFSDKAYTQSLSVIRNTAKEREIRSVDKADFNKFNLQDGDFVTVDSILSRFSNRVAITGAVFHPGNYELSAGMKLSDLIRKADGLREDAFMSRGIIRRLKEDNSPENISFDVKKVMQGQNDIILLKEDKVLINSIFGMREFRTVNITGEVIKPQTFEYRDNMTLGDLIFQAGGFSEEADLTVVEVSRRLTYDEAAKVSEKMNGIFKFSITRDLKLLPSDSAFKLQPLDEVFVRRAPGYRDQGTFSVTGEVTYAGIYVISDKNERISDAINRAGGLIPGAYTIGATLTRINKNTASEIEKKKELMKVDSSLSKNILPESGSYSVGIELNKILADPRSSIDLQLQPGDIINIPHQLQTVKISGNVMNPLALTFEKRLSVKKYINMAGGYSYKAKKSGTYVMYPNGTTATSHGFIFHRHSRVTPGSEIIVPAKPEKKEVDNTMKWVAIASALSTIALTLVTIIKL